MRREERATVQGPGKEQQPDGMSHRGRKRGPSDPTAPGEGEGEGGLRAGGGSSPLKEGWGDGKGALATGESKEASLQALMMTHHLRCKAAQKGFPP